MSDFIVIYVKFQLGKYKKTALQYQEKAILKFIRVHFLNADNPPVLCNCKTCRNQGPNSGYEQTASRQPV